MMVRVTAAVAAACVVAAANPIAAEDDDSPVFSTDRPDFVESSLTVGRGRFQFETSVAYERDKLGSTRATLWALPTLFRYGVSDMWELRLETDSVLRSEVTSAGTTTTDEGFADVSLGTKWHTRDAGPGGRAPAMAWLFHADLDSGSREFRGNGVRPSVRAVAEWGLPHDLSLGVMPGLAYDKDSTDRYVSGILGVVLGREWTSRLRSFVEIAFSQIASNVHGGDVATYDVGVAYLLRDNWQIDAAMSFGANADSPDFAWTVGLSALF